MRRSCFGRKERRHTKTGAGQDKASMLESWAAVPTAYADLALTQDHEKLTYHSLGRKASLSRKHTLTLTPPPTSVPGFHTLSHKLAEQKIRRVCRPPYVQVCDMVQRPPRTCARPPAPSTSTKNTSSTRLVVLGETLRTAGGARLDLPCAQPDSDVGDVVVLRLARPVRGHHAPAQLLGHLHGLDRLRYGSDLVHLVFIRCAMVVGGVDGPRVWRGQEREEKRFV